LTIEAVRLAIAQRLDDGRPSLCAVADELNLSVRTLQRRLAAAGWTYRDLVDDVRFAVARQRMARPDAPLKAVAVELGFSEQASFTRAFRRWIGFTPGEYRRQTLASAAVEEPGRSAGG
jgi:AraC-like DNA-binding protein